MGKEYTIYEKNESYGNSGIFKIIYVNDSYLELFGKRKLQSFEISCKYFFSF